VFAAGPPGALDVHAGVDPHAALQGIRSRAPYKVSSPTAEQYVRPSRAVDDVTTPGRPDRVVPRPGADDVSRGCPVRSSAAAVPSIEGDGIPGP
jgi:hypothetical protein